MTDAWIRVIPGKRGDMDEEAMAARERAMRIAARYIADVEAVESELRGARCSKPFSMKMDDACWAVLGSEEAVQPYCDVSLRWNGNHFRVSWRMRPGLVRNTMRVRNERVSDLDEEETPLVFVIHSVLGSMASACRLVSP